MALLLLGLVLFLGPHLVPTAPHSRAAIVARTGDNGYRVVFSILSIVGLVLIVIGYRIAPDDVRLFDPLAGVRSAAPLLVTLSFVLFAAANMRTHIRRTVRHPMLIGLMLWSGVHLLATGDLAGTVLFGSFVAYAVVDLTSAVRRGAAKVFAPTWKHDAIALAAGLALAFLTMQFHGAWFGTAPVV